MHNAQRGRPGSESLIAAVGQALWPDPIPCSHPRPGCLPPARGRIVLCVIASLSQAVGRT